MPIYEYACGDCGPEFESLLRSGTIPECPGLVVLEFISGGVFITNPFGRYFSEK